MNVRQGPDSVFSEDVEQIFPTLAGSAQTGENGRVGNELVFWRHRLADGREVYLVACAMISDVDCATREERVCPGPAYVLARATKPGLVHQRTCRSIAIAVPGEFDPGCIDRERSHRLSISLLQCR